MSVIKSFFSLFKKKDNTSQETTENSVEAISEGSESSTQLSSPNQEAIRDIEEECFICHTKIGSERYKKLQGKLVHKSCFKKGMSEALNGK